MTWPFEVPTLTGDLVQLEPIAPRHADDLRVAAEEDRSAYEFASVPHAAEVDRYLAAVLEQAQSGEAAPFAQIRRADGRAVGATSYWDPRFWPGRPDVAAVEIGSTWLGASAQRSGINVEAKLLLLEYAFETVGVARVDLKTDARNSRSRQAIQNLGAQFEGVLRNWSPSRAPGESGLLRDSAMFSVIASEWPTVKLRLRRRLDQRR